MILRRALGASALGAIGLCSVTARAQHRVTLGADVGPVFWAVKSGLARTHPGPAPTSPGQAPPSPASQAPLGVLGGVYGRLSIVGRFGIGARAEVGWLPRDNVLAGFTLGPDLEVIRDDCTPKRCGIVGRLELHGGAYRLVTWRPGFDAGFVLSGLTDPRVGVAVRAALVPNPSLGDSDVLAWGGFVVELGR